ncbi:CBS domain-containing protein [Chungangia koreensis]|uniref:CBS domain-containing protein n=1 Tax=Chungangia koreensis TaxID=752657 RepID=A0ABV8X6F7_9LACT
MKNLMSRDVVTCSPTDFAQEIVQNMRTLDIGSMPVIDKDQRVIGIITDRDLSTRTDLTSQSIVEDFMTKEVITITPESSAVEAAALMATYKIRRLPVIENGQLAGYLTLSELSVPEPIGSRSPIRQAIEGNSL